MVIFGPLEVIFGSLATQKPKSRERAEHGNFHLIRKKNTNLVCELWHCVYWVPFFSVIFSPFIYRLSLFLISELLCWSTFKHGQLNIYI
jgi:hypothetical protein